MSKEPNLDDLSFDAVIPSALLLNENLEPNAIKLYAFVRGLTKARGYCYATNEYLSKCMKCDESTVKRLLLSLKTEGFVEIHTNKERIHWERRIYLGVDFNKCLRRLKNEPPPAQNQASPSSKMSHNRRYVIEDIESQDCSVPDLGVSGQAPESAPIFSEKEVHQNEEATIPNSRNEPQKISKQEIISWAVRSKKDYSLLEIQEVWKILKEQKVINDFFLFTEGTVKILRNKKNLDKLNDKTKKKGPICQPTPQIPQSAAKIEESHNRIRSGNDFAKQLFPTHSSQEKT